MHDTDNFGVYHFNNLFEKEEKLFNAMRLFQVGDLRCRETTRINPHKQVCFEITYVVSGKGYCTINENRMELTEGIINIALKNDMHSITPYPEDPIRYFFLGIELLISHPHYNHLKEFQIKLRKSSSRNKMDKFNVKDIFIRCLAEFEHPNSFSNTIIESTINQILCYTFQNFELKIYDYDPFYDSTESFIHGIVSYIDQNITKITSVMDVLKEFSYSQSHISHTFSRIMNKTLIGYINDCRLNRALSMIESKRYTISQIAETLGYSSIHTFSRAFKKQYNVSPIYYRQNGKSEKEVDLLNNVIDY